MPKAPNIYQPWEPPMRGSDKNLQANDELRRTQNRQHRLERLLAASEQDRIDLTRRVGQLVSERDHLAEEVDHLQDLLWEASERDE